MRRLLGRVKSIPSRHQAKREENSQKLLATQGLASHTKQPSAGREISDAMQLTFFHTSCRACRYDAQPWLAQASGFPEA